MFFDAKQRLALTNMSGKDQRSKASSSRNTVGSSSSISSSFLGLKAELERSKASSSSLASSSSKRKPDDLDRPSRRKLSSTFIAPSSSPDQHKRSKSATDHSSSKRSSSTSSSNDPTSSQLERIKHNLERKARIYSQLESGKYGGFTSFELKEGSIDWDRKRSQPPPTRALSPSPPLIDDKDEREVEYVDEFGRTRRSKLSEVPREFLPKEYGGDFEEGNEKEEEDNAIYGPSTSFPVYNPDVHRREKYAKEERKYFDPDFDRRHRGAAFYRFSDKENERKAQLDQLAELRNETRRNRNEVE